MNKTSANSMDKSLSTSIENIQEQDFSNEIYEIYQGNRRCLSIEMSNHRLIFNGEDYGEACKSMNGKLEYEFHYILDQDSTRRLLAALRLKHGTSNKLSDIFQTEFGYDDGSLRFKNYCDEVGVSAHFIAL